MKTQVMESQKFGCLLEGYKTFIYQKERRDYRIGNVIRFLETDIHTRKQTGRHCAFTMIYRECLGCGLTGDPMEIVGLRRIPTAATNPTIEETLNSKSS